MINEEKVKMKILSELDIKRISKYDWEHELEILKEELTLKQIEEIIEKYSFDIILLMPNIKKNQEKLHYYVMELIKKKKEIIKTDKNLYIPNSFLGGINKKTLKKKKTIFDTLKEWREKNI
ncbi:hypothetical protein [Peptostreptococcus faecalis]|uniref:hypothetical protein n=1 Tax=Peptostreptococcus faecalis TaxID=2045015 RepID=UPI000C7BAECC|nr:hypothetical protein [Peptostreptococcus faecalis]